MILNAKIDYAQAPWSECTYADSAARSMCAQHRCSILKCVRYGEYPSVVTGMCSRSLMYFSMTSPPRESMASTKVTLSVRTTQT